MEQVERVGISLEESLLSAFDEMIAKQGYQSRSEAIRDLIRERLSNERLADPKTKAVASVCMVYNHHATKLLEKLTGLQHSSLVHTICSMHIHLDEHDCMEIVVLKGPVGEINNVADSILSQKGVKLGKVSLITTEAV